MIIKDAVVMHIMKTQNGLDITQEMVEDSLDTFEKAPVIHNPGSIIKDYTEANKKTYIRETYAIGYIMNKPHIVGNEVRADIMIWDKYQHLWHGHYDNWSIILDAERYYGFKFNSLEVF